MMITKSELFHSSVWTRKEFEENMKIIESEIQKIDPLISFACHEYGIGGSFNKTLHGEKAWISITSWGYRSSRYSESTTKAITIHYDRYDTKRAFTKNPNVIFSEIEKIVKTINQEIQYKLQDAIKRPSSIRAHERREQEWKETVDLLGGEVTHHYGARFGKLVVERADRHEITPTTFKISGIVDIEKLKKIQEIVNNG